MKKALVALTLASVALASHATRVGWWFGGTVPDDDFGVVRFSAYVEIDTKAITYGPHWDGPGTALGFSTVSWNAEGVGGCSGSHHTNLSRYVAGPFGVEISSLFPGDDCAVWASVGAQGTGYFEDRNDPLTQVYDLTSSDWSVDISLMGPLRSFQAVSVDYVRQNVVAEPSPVALIGAGLAGLIWVRRRKDTRDLA